MLTCGSIRMRTQSVRPTETARIQLAGGGLARPLIELAASLRAHLDVISRPALAAGRSAADGAAAGPVQPEIAWIGFARRVDDEAVLVTVNPGEVTCVV